MYCNYSKDKFGNELTFIKPYWFNEDRMERCSKDLEMSPELCLMKTLKYSETYYLKMLKLNCSPQEARALLPNALKTELVMTGFVTDWNDFFNLRTSFLSKTGKPHPDASALADSLYTKCALWQNTKEYL